MMLFTLPWSSLLPEPHCINHDLKSNHGSCINRYKPRCYNLINAVNKKFEIFFLSFSEKTLLLQKIRLKYIGKQLENKQLIFDIGDVLPKSTYGRADVKILLNSSNWIIWCSVCLLYKLSNRCGNLVGNHTKYNTRQAPHFSAEGCDWGFSYFWHNWIMNAKNLL